MKKFTKLDEELIKELASSAERFDFHYNEIVEKINLIQSELSNYKEKFLKEPNNWGYTGSCCKHRNGSYLYNHSHG